MQHLSDEDQITSTHRGHGHLVAKGGEFKPMYAELFGRSTGYCGGKGGSMHISNMELGMLGEWYCRRGTSNSYGCGVFE